MRLLKQSSTAQPLMFLLIDSTDHVTAKTGLTPTVTLSKNGAAFASPAGSVTELSNGWYKVAGNATDTGTLGPLILHATGTGADPVDVEFEVVAFDPQSATNLGLSDITAIKTKTDFLPSATAGAAGGLLIAGSNAATTFATLTVTGATTLGPVAITNSSGIGLTITGSTGGMYVEGTVGGGLILTSTTGDIRLVGTGTIKNVADGIVLKANATQLAGQTVTAAAGVTFPTTVASTTNITAGTLTTVTNLTNLPAAPTDWLTAAAVKADAVTKIQSGLSTYDGSDTSGVTTLLKSGTTVGSDFVFSTAALANGPAGGGGTFTGANAVTITVQDSTPTLLSSASVRITQGSNSQLTQTNASGVATFSLDDGTYTISITKGGYTFTPTTITVSAGSTSFTETMTAQAVSVPSTGQCTGTLLVVDEFGAPEAGVSIVFRAAGSGTADGYTYDSAETTSTSDGAGVVSRLFPSGSVPYQYRRGTTKQWTAFTTAAADGDTFDIPSNVGTP